MKPKRKNIGIVTTWFERGAGYVSKIFAHALESDGHRIFIYARGGESFGRGDVNWNQRNVTWNSFQRSPIPTDINKRQFQKWLVRNEIEILIFNEQQYWQPIFWAKELGITTAAYVDYYTDHTIDFFELYDCLICNTRQHMKAMMRYTSAAYLPWGTDLNLFKPSVRKRQIVSNNRKTIFHSAGMSPYRKGTDILIKSLSQLVKKGELGFNVLIHTQVDLKRIFPDLKSDLQQLENLNSIKFITKTVPAPGLFSEGDIYVYPSRLEGIGLTLAEAAACGLPVITTDFGPMNEFIVPNCGWKLEVHHQFTRNDNYFWPMSEVSPEHLAHTIEKAVNEYKPEMKNAVRQYAEEKLNMTTNLSELSEILVTSIAKKSHYNKDLAIRINKFESQKYKMWMLTPAPIKSIYSLVYFIYKKFK